MQRGISCLVVVVLIIGRSYCLGKRPFHLNKFPNRFGFLLVAGRRTHWSLTLIFTALSIFLSIPGCGFSVFDLRGSWGKRKVKAWILCFLAFLLRLCDGKEDDVSVKIWAEDKYDIRVLLFEFPAEYLGCKWAELLCFLFEMYSKGKLIVFCFARDLVEG